MILATIMLIDICNKRVFISFYKSNSSKGKVMSHCDFDGISLTATTLEHVFLYFLAIGISSF